MLRPRWLRTESRLLLALTVLAMLGGLAAAFWLLFHFVRPAPPRSVTMVTGAPGGAYALFAERYRAALAREGVELVLKPSSGAVENLRRLKTEDVDLGFVQGGIANEPDSEDLVLLGNMYVEPVWIFHRIRDCTASSAHPARRPATTEPCRLTRLDQLAGRRIAVGSAGSGTQLLALQLLSASGISLSADGLVPLDGNAAADALLGGMIDAAFIVGAPEAPAVQRLLAAPDIELLDLTHAEAYARRFPHLSPLRLPAGTIDLAAVRPAQDVHLLGTTAELVARADLHPAIVSLLLQAGRDIHGQAGLFQHAGEYPRLIGAELPPSQTARRFYESGPPFLQRYLPFWLAVMADRLLVSLLPVLALLVPLVRVTPALYAWRMHARIYRWYGELKLLEREVDGSLADGKLDEWLARLDRLEDQANRRKIPLAFANELYTLREHINLVRRNVRRRAARMEDRSPLADAPLQLDSAG